MPSHGGVTGFTPLHERATFARMLHLAQPVLSSMVCMRYTREEYANMQAVQRRVARAEADYARFRAAYLEIAQSEPDHEVALAMIGADMNRAHAYLQALIGLPPTPFEKQPSVVVMREARRLAEEKNR